MTQKITAAPSIRKLTAADIRASLALGVRDFRSAPLLGFFFAGFFVIAGLAIAAITYWTGQTFWLVLAVLGFPMIGTLASIGFYEISRQQGTQKSFKPKDVVKFVWSCRAGQIPWLAAIVVVIFLFWFFLGHMIFALFLGLTPMTNISTSLTVFASTQGATMIIVGTAIGAAFSALVFSISVHGMPMLIDRDVDFITAMITSVSAVLKSIPLYLAWAGLISVIILISILPGFIGLFVTMPILGHTSWHLYKRLSVEPLS